MWLYDGKPEYVNINVNDTNINEGGYIVAIELNSGNIRLAATRQPGKYLAVIKNNIMQYGSSNIVRVLISKPYMKYEAIKRAIAASLRDFLDEKSKSYNLNIDTFLSLIKEINNYIAEQQNRKQ